ncbi:Chromatin assembly factor 1, subunit A [Mortierella alpina]|uniref:Chromatin assembly factor 1, subunit A n=1 Tax=Mortierella alpina TaxID=64518 RepID=A0A9P6M6I2_MORAP|nr:Chromatin assembly factor 1, subunit A [Mortierella alpina]
MSRTLSGFFCKDGSAPAVKADSQGQASVANTETQASHPVEAGNVATPEKPKPRKRVSKAKPSESAENLKSTGASDTTTATGAKSDNSKRSPKPKSKKGTKTEVLSEVVIPKAPRTPKKNSKPAGTMESSPRQEFKKASPTVTSSSTASPFLVDTKESPRSPSKNGTGGSSVSNIAATGTSSGLSKFNKVDTASMFKVRNGKAFITENKLKFSSHPSAIADLCKFHEYREMLRDAEDLSQYPGTVLVEDHVEITSIPTEQLGIIAKLVEESELLLQEMATSFMPTLCPLGFEAFEDFAATVNAQDDSEAMDVDVECTEDKKTPTRRSGTTVSSTAIMEAIQSVAQRVNYGVPVSNLPGPVTVTPANLSVYRWEVQDIDRYFPSDMRAAVVKRRHKRMEASAALTAWFLGLDATQQEELCPVPVTAFKVPGVLFGAESGVAFAGKRNRSSLGGETMDVDAEANPFMVVTTNADGVTRPGSVLLQGQPTVEAAVDPAVIESKMKEAEAKKKEAEAKEERRLEKERKMVEKQLEKDLREAERVQKEEAKKRKAEEERLKKEQTSLRFVGFFKTATAPAAKKDNTQAFSNDTNASALMERFHPFHVKKNTTLAPLNRFSKDDCTNESMDHALGLCPRMDSEGDSDVDMDVDSDQDVVPVVSTSDVKAPLSSLLSKSSRRAGQQTNGHRVKRLPGNCKSMTVAEVMQSGLLLQDQEDDSDCVLSWRDIPALRLRLFQFAENYRPAYYGTWSKRSKLINGRRFLSKDTDLIEYDIDSEAEWEEDEEGEECKSDEDDEDADEMGSELEEEDDWLVPEGYLSDDEGLDAGEEGGSKSDVKKSKEQRRPTLAHITPVIVGPIFEMTLGEISCHAALEPYHIEFLGEKKSPPIE